MIRKVRDTALLLCATCLTIWLYLFGTVSLSVTDKLYVQPLCHSPELTSSYNIDTEILPWEIVENNVRNVQLGGRFTPKDCISMWKVAIIIPYRDRENHLKVFLRNIHPFLQQQKLEYGIFVIEMPPYTDFNRGLLMNAGFKESSELLNYNCFIFHDVDLLPEAVGNDYKCSDYPKHMASAVDTRNYTMPYETYFGGVNAFSKEQFSLVNGFPNVYFGWGSEDDDLYHRVLNANLTVQRLSHDIGRYRNLGHQRSVQGKGIEKLYNTKQQRYLSDGLNNLKYKRISYNFRPLCTWISIGLYNYTGQIMQEVQNGE